MQLPSVFFFDLRALYVYMERFCEQKIKVCLDFFWFFTLFIKFQFSEASQSKKKQKKRMVVLVSTLIVKSYIALVMYYAPFYYLSHTPELCTVYYGALVGFCVVRKHFSSSIQVSLDSHNLLIHRFYDSGLILIRHLPREVQERSIQIFLQTQNLNTVHDFINDYLGALAQHAPVTP